MITSEQQAAEEHVDFFGISDYLGHPKALFVLFGHLGQLVGGVELGHMRLLHGALALLAIAASYGLFRQLLPAAGPRSRRASSASTTPSSCSAGWRCGRTPSCSSKSWRFLLLRGLRHDHPLLTFLGGIVAGLEFYVYFPGRAIFLLWLLFLAGLALWFRKSIPVGRVAGWARSPPASVVVTAGPVVVAGLQVRPELREQQRLALLVFSEAREIQKEWVFSDSVTGESEKNISYGLLAFNSDRSDRGDFLNLGHGFVDPLTGLLLWIGAGVVLVRLVHAARGAVGLAPARRFSHPLARAGLCRQQGAELSTSAHHAPVRRVSRSGGGSSCRGASAHAPRGEPTGVGLARGRRTGRDYGRRRCRVEPCRSPGISSRSGGGRATTSGPTGRYITSHSGTADERFYLAASEGEPYYVWGTRRSGGNGW